MKHRKLNASLVGLPLLLAACMALVAGTGVSRPGFTQEHEERKLKVHNYNRMPVVVKEIRNLNKKEHWFRDLEIEVKNVSRQPIYFISLGLKFPNIPAFTAPQPLPDGNMPTKVTTGFSVNYGASRLSDLRVLAGPDDVPIKPGETHVFKIPEAKVIGIEWMNQNMNLPPDAWKQVELTFNLISFGDGTGFMGSRRELYSKKKAGEQ